MRNIDWSLVDQLIKMNEATTGIRLSRPQTLNLAIQGNLLRPNGHATDFAIKTGLIGTEATAQRHKNALKHLAFNAGYRRVLMNTADFVIKRAASTLMNEKLGQRLIDSAADVQGTLVNKSVPDYRPQDWRAVLLLSYIAYWTEKRHNPDPGTVRMLHLYFEQTCTKFVKAVGNQDKALDSISTIIKDVQKLF